MIHTIERPRVDATQPPATPPLPRRTGVAGLAFTALIVGQGAAAAGVPAPDAPAADVAAWLAAHRTEALVYAYLLLATAACFAAYTAPLCRAVATGHRSRGDHAVLAAIGAAGAAAVLSLGAVAQVVAVYLSGGPSGAEASTVTVIAALYVTTTIGSNVVAAWWAVTAAATCLGSWGQPGRRWLAPLSGAAAVGGVLIAACVGRTGTLAGTSPLLAVGILLVLAWVVTTSVAALRHRADRVVPSVAGAR